VSTETGVTAAGEAARMVADVLDDSAGRIGPQALLSMAK
jgi:hypothetical protein